MHIHYRHIPVRALLLVLTVISLAACSEAPRQQAAGPVIPYIRLSGENVTLNKELPGRVSAFTVAEVRPQVGGIILERFFEEGSEVQAGQILYQIDPVLYQAAYNNAKAELARVQANEKAARLLAERRATLVKKGAVGKQEYDDAVAAYARAKAEIDAASEALETARINLSYTKVSAPISGIIGRSFVTSGALVTQHQTSPLTTVQQISPVYVDVSQSSTELLRLRRDLAQGKLQNGEGSAAKVRLYLEDGTPYTRSLSDTGENPEWIEGELLFSDITVNQSTSVVNIRVKFDNPEGVLLPGTYVRAVIEEGTAENALLVPQKSVNRDLANRPQVHVLTKSNPDGEAQDARPLGEDEFYVTARPVNIDRDYDNKWLVSGNLDPGEFLVVDGLLHVQPGMVVSGKEVTNVTALASSQRETDSTER